MKEINLNQHVDHLFRQESGKMVAVLVNIFGTQHLELAEDVVQNTLIKALEVWKFKGIPAEPKAWLYRVAKNNVIDILRKEKRSKLIDFSHAERKLLSSEYTLEHAVRNYWEEEQIKDEFLAMMFASCHSEISTENQVTFILKTLCGFSTKEIASAFITSEPIISKRLYRTKEHFRKNQLYPQIPEENELQERLKTVLSVIYLMFNEGYTSRGSDNLIRIDLIEQALFLGNALLEHPKTSLAEVYALMALMCFHAARSESRVGKAGELILLEEQNRDKWNKEYIQAGRNYLKQSAFGARISSYHFEALIAFEHCSAKDFKSTNWQAIYTNYQHLLSYRFDPIVYLNQCLVILELHGAKEALAALEKIENNKQIKKYYLFYSVKAEMYAQLKEKTKASEFLKKAIAIAPSKSEKLFLEKKMNRVQLIN